MSYLVERMRAFLSEADEDWTDAEIIDFFLKGKEIHLDKETEHDLILGGQRAVGIARSIARDLQIMQAALNEIQEQLQEASQGYQVMKMQIQSLHDLIDNMQSDIKRQKAIIGDLLKIKQDLLTSVEGEALNRTLVGIYHRIENPTVEAR